MERAGCWASSAFIRLIKAVCASSNLSKDFQHPQDSGVFFQQLLQVEIKRRLLLSEPEGYCRLKLPPFTIQRDKELPELPLSLPELHLIRSRAAAAAIPASPRSCGGSDRGMVGYGKDNLLQLLQSLVVEGHYVHRSHIPPHDLLHNLLEWNKMPQGVLLQLLVVPSS
ncbi:hypothetical protein EJB05_08364 [Eragrostis curvula]|uniref:Uncharacterized protein n=1 Tax=Eragrostis curvula TaxID=38414 RepID=A0A5J9W3B1_9POAL|nr:hypothetical protein EJB05_08364 [Eragrostis curvula]